MAKKEETKIVLERNYNVPLRREWLKAPKWKRSKKATIALRQFLQRHMKSDDVKIGKYLNLAIWEKGIRNPPHHVKVIAKKDDKGVVMAELEGAPVEKKEEAPKKGVEKKIEKAVEEKKEEKPQQEKGAEKPAPKKPEEKKEEPKKAEEKK
jgi:large subunit ribosomal protein L31e